MKKWTFLVILASAGLLVGCSNGASNSDTSNSNNSSSSSSVSSSNSSNESSSKNSEASVQSSEVSQDSSSVASSSSSSSVASSVAPSSSSSSEASGTITNQDEAIVRIREAEPTYKDENEFIIKFSQMVESDYLFSITSQSIKNQGGSGTVGFYRVTPAGQVTLTDSSGTAL
ncbi:hypothetical protein ACWOFR_00810 [Carnobacterium gallinarum]|uniref:hypothetical protein n=1 Tax=Carnobacterium gallinarum TaxID=2749 RepID=UPI000558949E|nr:hypothetical protein [Carnobacterium gallinarum]